MTPRAARLALVAALALAWPSSALAQVYATISAGASHTTPADVTVSVPSAGLGVTYHDVQFSGRSFDSPQYYVWRLGKLFGPSARWGVEFQFTHLKVIADTSKSYVASGQINGVALPGGPSVPMNAVVEEYQMTHGLNFLTVNGVGRWPIGHRLSLVGRLGVGTTLPHAETSVLGQASQHYEFAGLGVEGSAGVALKLTHLISLVSDYKVSDAHPRITVVAGTGQMSAISHQIMFGLAFGFAR